MRKRIIKFSLFLVVLIVVFLVIMQFVLLTDIPRKIIVSSLTSRLGMDVNIDTFQTGWGGETFISDLSFRLPLEDSNFLEMKDIQLDHTSLIPILFNRSFNLNNISVGEITLKAHQAENGRWNLNDVLGMISQKNTGPEDNSALLKLPKATVDKLYIQIDDNQQKHTIIGPFNFSGTPRETYVWDFQIELAERQAIDGFLALPRLNSHTLKFDVEVLDEIFQDWLPDSLKPLRLKGQWSAISDSKGLKGELKLEQTLIGEMLLEGKILVSTGNSGLDLQPKNLSISHPRLPYPRDTTIDGKIRWKSNVIQVDHLAVTSGPYLLDVYSQWALIDNQISLNGEWITSDPNHPVRSQGRWRGIISTGKSGLKNAHLTLETENKSENESWQVGLDVAGKGKSWLQSQWKISAVPLNRWRQDDLVQFGPASAELNLNWPLVHLEHLEWAKADQLQADGQYDFNKEVWTASIIASKIDLREWGLDYLDLSSSISGTSEQIQLFETQISHPQVKVAMNGELTFPNLDVKEGQINIQGTLPFYDPNHNLHAISESPWQLNAMLNSNISPAVLDIQGDLEVSSKGADNTLVEIVIPLTAEFQNKQLHIESEPFTFSDGQWQLAGRYDIGKNAGRLKLDIKQLSLSNILSFFNISPEGEGFLTANLDMILPMPTLDSLNISGQWQVKDLCFQAFAAEYAEGNIHLEDQVIAINNIKVFQGKGQIEGQVITPLGHPQVIHVDLQSHQWPLTVEQLPFKFIVDGDAEMKIDTSQKTTAMRLAELNTQIKLTDEHFGTIELHAQADSNSVSITIPPCQLLTGTLKGQLYTSLEQWTLPRLDLTWVAIELESLKAWWPFLEGLSGSSSGQIQLEPTEEIHPLEPLKLVLKTQFDQAAYKTARLNEAEIIAYLGSSRIIVNQSQFSCLDGTIRTRARLIPHDDKFNILLNTDLEALDLDQLVHVFLPNANPVVGRLSGKGVLITAGSLQGLSCNLDLNLNQLALGGNIIIGTIYKTLNLKFNHQPTGQGKIKVQCEGNRVKIPSFYYFHQGLEIRGEGTIQDVQKGKDSPIAGFVFGTTRPLRDIALPGVEELDRLITSLLKDIVVVRVDGTLAEPNPQVVPVPEVSDTIRRLIWEQLRGNDK